MRHACQSPNVRFLLIISQTDKHDAVVSGRRTRQDTRDALDAPGVSPSIRFDAALCGGPSLRACVGPSCDRKGAGLAFAKLPSLTVGVRRRKGAGLAFAKLPSLTVGVR
jgi:hypothetical protein